MHILINRVFLNKVFHAQIKLQLSIDPTICGGNVSFDAENVSLSLNFIIYNRFERGIRIRGSKFTD